MSARSKARKRALDVLFEADLRSASAAGILAERQAQRAGEGSPPLPDYAVDLVEGVLSHRDRIDGLISTHAEGWTLERLPTVDRQVLRIALFELLYRDDVPAAVVIDEAVELAKDLSTDDSPRFVNGLLGAVLRSPETSRQAAPTPE